MIRSLVTALMFVASAGLAAAQESGPQTGEQPEMRSDRPARQELTSRPGSVLVLRGLDKITARTEDFEIRVGETHVFGSLEITARYCRRRPPEETPEIFAFMQIADRRTDGFGSEDESETVFSGWMFGSNPALNPLEHPVYDVWVIDCRA
ncbi:DUF2155 domain-containing protein [Hyphobacterium sp. SN044]|uniref:DUF2155 domain-containing protein n=1 Tax=Hyphobacterium sp. SN044 TaxID=2912575 RepID=UPI001F38151F|nr:DUF2155 domain-containing protein [Hyphobacterium sp. SN044]MCF8878743.1 DUF2155 domain-containing protein [Hyphobacterium sp. SN044]